MWLLRRGDSEVMLERVEAAAKTKLRMSGRELLGQEMPVSRAGVLSSRGMALPECPCQGEPTCVYAVRAHALVLMFLKENPGDTVPYEMTCFLWTRVRRHRRAAVFS